MSFLPRRPISPKNDFVFSFLETFPKEAITEPTKEGADSGESAPVSADVACCVTCRIFCA
jgi:hypothetical protein